MTVALAKPLQSLLRGSPPSLLRSNYYDATRVEHLEQASFRIPRENNAHLRSLNTARHLARLLTQDAEGNRRIAQIQRKRHGLQPHYMNGGWNCRSHLFRLSDSEPGELWGRIGHHDIEGRCFDRNGFKLRNNEWHWFLPIPTIIPGALRSYK